MKKKKSVRGNFVGWKVSLQILSWDNPLDCSIKALVEEPDGTVYYEAALEDGKTMFLNSGEVSWVMRKTRLIADPPPIKLRTVSRKRDKTRLTLLK